MKIFKITLLLLSILIISCNSSSENLNPKDAEIEKRVSDLLSKMTLEEKIGQMVQTNYKNHVVKEEEKELIRQGKIGSFLNMDELDAKMMVQKIAVEESRLGIPLIFGRDVIHGYRTMFPIPLAQSCSWNPELVEAASSIAAKEAATNGVTWTFAPMIDMCKDPRWGRISETCGEDPYLTSVYSKAMVRGFQGDDPTLPGKIAACAKHYVGYGAAESGKDYNSVYIPEVELRNIYLPPFQAAIEEDVLTFMSGFHDINGIPATGNQYTLRTILRDEWNYKGFVVSDWGSVFELVAHGYATDKKHSAEKSALAGVDMEMVTGAYDEFLLGLVEDGKVPIEYINQSAGNILRVKFKLGLFENPYKQLKKEGNILTEEHLNVAKELAIESCVLLENSNDLLPLSETVSKVAVIGPLANAPYDQLGMWTIDGRREDSKTPLQGIQDLLGKDKVLFAQGLATSRTETTEGFNAAIQAAKQSDIILFFAGEESILSGEAHSRAFIDIPGAQVELINELKKTGKPIVAIVMAGRPLIFKEDLKNVDAILWAWHGGTMAGPAIADLLFGKAVPSGKLTVSFPRTEGQIPVYYNHRNTGRPPVDGNFGIPTGTTLDPVGYTCNYLDCSVAPEYPFGYGLSYSEIKYSNLTLESASIKMGEEIIVSVTIENKGKYDVQEVVQLYIRDIVGRITRPVKELKAFEKVLIAAGETKTVTLTISTNDLAFWDENKVYKAEAGDFKLFVGGNVEEVLEAEFVLTD